jgi:hypothetical protein
MIASFTLHGRFLPTLLIIAKVELQNIRLKGK